MMVLIAYLPNDDDAMCALPLDDAMDRAFACLGPVRAVFAHPKIDGFVILGVQLFATVERTVGQGLYVVRLARYGAGGSRGIERQIKKQGYDEVAEVGDGG